jgi:hypothetical protein
MMDDEDDALLEQGWDDGKGGMESSIVVIKWQWSFSPYNTEEQTSNGQRFCRLETRYAKISFTPHFK